MSTAKLNIWISELDDPCKVSNRIWYVTIYNCDGKPLEWCNRRYTIMPAKCGHLEVEVPPGCYRINALWSGIIPGQCGMSFFPIHRFTDSAVVQACCGGETCITLFSASARRSGIIFARTIRNLMKQNVIKPELAKRAESVLEEVTKALPEPLSDFELGHLDEIDKLIEDEEEKRREKVDVEGK